MVNLKEVIEKGLKEKGVSARRMCIETHVSEPTLYRLYRENSANYNTLRIISEYLNIDLRGIETTKETVSTTDNRDSIIDFLKRENDMLKGFIREKMAINFNVVSGFATV